MRESLINWGLKYYQLTGHQPSRNDKESSKIFNELAQDYHNVQKKLIPIITDIRQVALNAECLRYQYEISVHYLSIGNQDKQLPIYHYRFSVPEISCWEIVEDAFDVGLKNDYKNSNNNDEKKNNHYVSRQPSMCSILVKLSP